MNTTSNNCLAVDDKGVLVISFYRFVKLPAYAALRSPLLQLCQQEGLRGTILLAGEGINATVAGKRDGIETLLAYLRGMAPFTGLTCRESRSSGPPFHRMKVRLKKEIVSLGVGELDVEGSTAIKLDAKAWNQVISDPEVLLIDTRNRYECEIGRFANAVTPETDSFGEFPRYVSRELGKHRHSKVAMYCTGGIRCEKASAYLRSQGFTEVYQLDGGILKYLEDMDSDGSLWQGECFVFDDRVSVDGQLAPGVHRQCFACRWPLSPADRDRPEYEEGISCHRCFSQLSATKKQGVRERHKQVKLAAQRQQAHVGAKMPARDPGSDLS